MSYTRDRSDKPLLRSPARSDGEASATFSATSSMWMIGGSRRPAATDRQAASTVATVMNFSISGGIGFVGDVILFGALMIAFTIAVALVIRAVRGREDPPVESGERASEDEFTL